MSSQPTYPSRRARRLLPLLVALVTLCTLATVGRPAAAEAGDAVAELPLKEGTPTAVSAGQTIQYTINYTCSNNEGEAPPDGCDGTEFADPVPTFTNVYGEEQPLEFVSATGPASVWPGGFTLDSSDAANPVVRSTAGAFPPGASGSIFITVRVPANGVPQGTQAVTNQAQLTDPDRPGQPMASPIATTQITGAAPQWTIDKSGPTADTRGDRDYDWTVAVCAASATSALWPIFEITDTLPEGFQFVAAERGGTYVDDGAPQDNVSAGAGTVTWTFDAANRPPMGSDGCFRFRVTGRFPSSDPSNVPGTEKTNTVAGVGRTTPAGVATGIGQDSVTSTLLGPIFASADTTKSFTTHPGGAGNLYVEDGDIARFNLGATVDSDFQLDTVTLTDGTWTLDGGPSSDGMPPTFTPTELDPGTWNAATTATILGSDDDFASSTTVASGVASGAANIPLGTPFRSFRWVWSDPGAIPGDFQASGLQIIGTIGAGPVGDYRNTSRLEVLRSGADPEIDTASDNYILEAPLPHADVTKTVANSSRQPGQTTTYTLRVANSGDATGDLVDPVLTDCIPEYLELQGTPAASLPWAADPVAPCDPDGAGPLGMVGTGLRYTWNGTLQPGQQTSTVTYTVLVAPFDAGDADAVAPPGTYRNTATVSPSGGGAFDHCVDTNPSCGATATLTVTPVVELNSQKCVTGVLDGGVFRPTPRCTSGEPEQTPALTTPGGAITYRLDLQNAGNTDADTIDFIDTFPRVGDTAVRTATGGVLNPRHSEYRPILVEPIAAPPGWVVAYSTSDDPCRPEVGGPSTAGVNCDAPNWTTSPDPLALSTYRSVKLSFAGTLARGATASFSWDMRSPVVDPTYDQGGTSSSDPYEFLDGCTPFTSRTDPTHCPRAVNSFAYGANATNLPAGVPQPGRLFAEPPQVEVRVAEAPSANVLGNRVWLDHDIDGRQDDPADEPGVPDVLVQLRSADGSTVLAETYTDANGLYLFDHVGGVDVPDGEYVVRFYPPPGWYLSPADVDDAGGTSDADSDVPRTPTGTDGTGAYHQTPVITLGDVPDGPEVDLTWDAGLWQPDPEFEITKVTRDSAWDPADAGDDVSIIQGRPVTWTYTVTNTGNTRLEDVAIGDDGGPAAPFAVTACTMVDGGVNLDGLSSSATAPIAMNRGAVLECVATGTAGASAYTNVGDVVGTSTFDDGTPIDGLPPVTDTDPSGYTPGAYDLALAKTVGTPDVGTGAVTFTITVRNQGTVPSGSYTVTDVLPAGISFVSSTPAPTTTTPALTWTLDDLDPGQNRTITVEAEIDDYTARPYRNHAEITDDSADTYGTTDIDSTPDADPGNDGDYGPVGTPSAVDNVGPGAVGQAGAGADPEDDADVADLDLDLEYDLALAKVPADAEIEFGEQPVFQVRVHNEGTVRSGPVTVLDQLPTGLSFDAAGSTAGCAAIAANRVRCSIDDIAPDGSTLLTIATTIDGSPDVHGTAPWRNWAEIEDDSAQELYLLDDADSTPEGDDPNGIGQDGTPPGDPHTDVTTAGPAYSPPVGPDEDDNDAAVVATAAVYDLALAKVADATAMTQDSDAAITYTITVRNQGTMPSGDYTVTDTLAPGLTPVTPIPGGGVVGGGGGSPVTVTWTGTNLEPGETATFAFDVTVTDLTVRPYRNVAEISDDAAEELYGLTDVDSVPNADPTDDNAGNGVADGDGYGPVGDPAGGGVDNLDVDLAGQGNDGEDDADIADVDFPLTGAYDLALAKIVSDPTTTYDGTVTFTVTVQNQGIIDSRSVEVTDHVPAGMEAVAASDGGVVADDGSTVVWTLANLDPGDTVALTVTARVVDVDERPFRNHAEITDDSADEYTVGADAIADVDSTPDDDRTNDGDYGDVADLDPIDNVGDDAITRAGVDDDPEDDADIADLVLPVTYDLALVKTGPGSIAPFGTAVFTIAVRNQGNVPSGPYDVTDDVPAGMTAVAVGNGGTIVAGGAQVVWDDLPSLDPGATATLTVTLRITDVTKRPYRNVAEITDDGADGYDTAAEDVADADSTPDDDPTSAVDNTAVDQAGQGDDAGFDDEDVATVTTTVTYDLALVKTVDAASIAPDGTARFTVTVVNQGNVPAGAFTVTDHVPPGLAVSGVSHGGTVAGGGSTVTWSLTDLQPGASVALTFDVRITDLSQRPYRNVAEIAADSAASYTAPGSPVGDADSVPGDTSTSTVDNIAVGEAGAGDDAGFDDEDVAVLTADVVYDLALTKRLLPGQHIRVGGVVRYEIEVVNEGNVPSHAYTVTDVLPDGMAFVSASDGATADGAVVTWADLPSLDPGASATLTIDARLVDAAPGRYVNVAEVTHDSAATYSVDGDTVKDVDSEPARVRGQDDEGEAVLSLDATGRPIVPPSPGVGGSTARPSPLPRTGDDPVVLLAIGGCLLLGGIGVGLLARRRRVLRS